MEQRNSGEVNYDALRKRVGVDFFRRRMDIQRHHAAQFIGQGRTTLHWENLALFRLALEVILHGCGLYRWGRRNAQSIRIHENPVVLSRLPKAFDGFRILQLSDLHLDLDPEITEAVIARLRNVSYDVCVITGDFRAETHGDFWPSIRETERLMPYLHGPVYGILGNHDFLEMTPPLEVIGIQMLINEHVMLERRGSIVCLAGVDDPHLYDTADLDLALFGVPPDTLIILLSHTAEPYRQAQGHGVDLMLTGHTHGGQICLPGGIRLLHSAHQPRRMDKGRWRYGDLQGYTSPGTGSCVAPVRFFCRPEITLHVLRSA